MLVVGRKEFDVFMTAHADSRSPLTTWLARATVARWQSPQDVLQWYPRASVIRKGFLVFDIKGNDYRLAAPIIALIGTKPLRIVTIRGMLASRHLLVREKEFRKTLKVLAEAGIIERAGSRYFMPAVKAPLLNVLGIVAEAGAR